MMEYLLADGLLPFNVALLVMVLIGIMESASLFFGLSVSSAIDSLFPDIDFDGPDAIPGHEGFLSQMFSWLSIGKVPALMLLVLFLTFFGLSGHTIQLFWQSLTGSMMPTGIAAAISTVTGLFGMGRVGAWLARVMPTGRTDVASHAEVLGAFATVIRGTAKPGFPAEAKARDLRGNWHYILVEPREGEPDLAQGEQAFIFRLKEGKGVFLVTNMIDSNSSKEED